MERDSKKEELLSLVEDLLQHDERERTIIETIYKEAKKINSQIMSAKPHMPFYISNDGKAIIYTGEMNDNHIDVYFGAVINGELAEACVHYMYKDAKDTIGIAAIVKHFHKDAVDTVKKLKDE